MLFPIILLCSSILAAPLLEQEKRRAAPSVVIANGTVIGTSFAEIDSFKGIPFAQPPTGSLRLKPPQPLTTGFGTFISQALPMSCPQFISQVDTSNLPSVVLGLLADSPFVQAITHSGEDCLNLNVQRPRGTTSSSKLPVVVWFFGGGFERGSTKNYDGTGLIKKSLELGSPIIYVAVNYRVGGFGFLAGSELQADGSTNLGLRDQRLGLEWVADNIAAFGGDPTKVTIWGESAGSISVFDQTIINGGDNTYNGHPLFRGAIMDSGSLAPAMNVSSAKPQAIYDQVVQVAGCQSNNSLECLRAVPYETFLNAVNSVPAIFGYRGVDLSYLPRPDPNSNFFSFSPQVALQNGNYAKVSIIIGDQEDEGTLFSLAQTNITDGTLLTEYLKSYFPMATEAQIAALVATYPDDPSYGSPYNTGDLYNVYPQFKRLAAILGDLTFTLTRRVYLSVVSSTVPTWSYISSYLEGMPFLGTFHGSDVIETYFGLPFPLPANSIKCYYIGFINSLNPNEFVGDPVAIGTIEWPQYNTSAPNLLNFQALANSIILDTFRESSYEYLLSNANIFEM
jgi:carboxylesterase type B